MKTKKVVINACHGGFSLSKEGMLKYAELKGIKIYPEEDSKYRSLGFITYWTVPPSKRIKQLEDDKWRELSLEERKKYNKKWHKQTIYVRDFDRDDPFLVKTVEELGDKANGMCAELKVVEIPANVDFVIEEYDGKEWIAEKHETWS